MPLFLILAGASPRHPRGQCPAPPPPFSKGGPERSRLQRRLRRVHRLGGHAGEPPQLAGQRRDYVRRGIHGHADDIHASRRSRYAHPPDDIPPIPVQQLVQLRHGAALADDDGHHSHPGLHTPSPSPEIIKNIPSAVRQRGSTQHSKTRGPPAPPLSSYGSGFTPRRQNDRIKFSVRRSERLWAASRERENHTTEKRRLSITVRRAARRNRRKRKLVSPERQSCLPAACRLRSHILTHSPFSINKNASITGFPWRHRLFYCDPRLLQATRITV